MVMIIFLREEKMSATKKMIIGKKNQDSAMPWRPKEF